MALYRTVSMSFWTDSKVVDDFSPEDRYFYLYLFTNPHTNLCGCYEISLKQMSVETGYNVETICTLLKRFEAVHRIVRYSPTTKEILLLNWHKYNWTTSEKFRKPLLKEIAEVKDSHYREYLQIVADGGDARYPIDTTCIDTSVTVTDTNTNTDSINNYSSIRSEIIDYLNGCTGKNFRSNASSTVRLLDARIKEGYTVEEFKKVIDNKVYEWMGTDQEQYLRPETLFTPSHFESYLNQQKTRKKTKQPKNTGRDWDKL